MRPCSLLEEQERSNSSSLMRVILPWLSSTSRWGAWTWACIIASVCCWFDCLIAEILSWVSDSLSVLVRSKVGAGWEASLHTASSSVCCWVSSERARTFMFSSTTWTEGEGQFPNKTQPREIHVAIYTRKFKTRMWIQFPGKINIQFSSLCDKFDNLFVSLLFSNMSHHCCDIEVVHNHYLLLKALNLKRTYCLQYFFSPCSLPLFPF